MSFILSQVSRRFKANNVRSIVRPFSSHWNQYEMGPPDPIVGLNEAFALDPSPHKVNVGVGAYRGDEGLPYVLPCVREAERINMQQELNHEYLGMVGDVEFVRLALEFVYGKDSPIFDDKRVAGVQTLSGTGGLRVFGELLKKGGHKEIYVPNPTWGNHIPIMQNAGLEVKKYRYYDAGISGLEFDNMIQDLKNIPEGAVVLLHACAHNVSTCTCTYILLLNFVSMFCSSGSSANYNMMQDDDDDVYFFINHLSLTRFIYYCNLFCPMYHNMY